MTSPPLPPTHALPPPPASDAEPPTCRHAVLSAAVPPSSSLDVERTRGALWQRDQLRRCRHFSPESKENGVIIHQQSGAHYCADLGHQGAVIQTPFFTTGICLCNTVRMSVPSKCLIKPW
ncbi:hypothetical protein DAI22_05g040300 [Oryza sativa Japonica Group]|nr:hypothetical protein DAI22_05g040300 [Oryza sativa Japonica Group]